MVLVLLFISSMALAAGDPYTQVETIARNVPGANVSVIGHSAGGRPMLAVTMTSAEENTADLPRVLVMAGQHGNEKMPVRAALDIAGSLQDSEVMRRVVLVIVPVVNPDGYAASKRLNAAGVDLNRCWNTLDQPETKTVLKLVEAFRPQVLIDLHEWASDDPYSPDCVEVAGYGTDACRKLSRILARKVESDTGGALRQATYQPKTDQRLAHRWFTSQGICTILVETSPRMSRSKRMQAYREQVLTVLNAVSSKEDPNVTYCLAQIKGKNPTQVAWLAQLEVKPNPAAGLPYLLVTFGVLGVVVVGALVSGGKSDYSKTEQRATVASVLESNLYLRQKRLMLKECRHRANDRVTPEDDISQGFGYEILAG